MLKADKVVVLKVLGMILTIGGMIASNWSSKQETDATLEKLVNKKFNNE